MLQPSPLSPSFTHYLPCSRGYNALTLAKICGITFKLKNNADVVAYLRNIDPQFGED